MGLLAAAILDLFPSSVLSTPDRVPRLRDNHCSRFTLENVLDGVTLKTGDARFARHGPETRKSENVD